MDTGHINQNLIEYLYFHHQSDTYTNRIKPVVAKRNGFEKNYENDEESGLAFN